MYDFYNCESMAKKMTMTFKVYGQVYREICRCEGTKRHRHIRSSSAKPYSLSFNHSRNIGLNSIIKYYLP